VTPTIASAEDFGRRIDELADPACIRSAEAASPQVWWDVLQRLPQHAVWVAANRTIPAGVVQRLASHDSLQVRVAIASNPAIARDVMSSLAHDRSDLVRMRVACNANASRDVLMALAADSCVVVSRHAQARLLHDLRGVTLPASYLADVAMSDILH
jgi:hypothetical protein